MESPIPRPEAKQTMSTQHDIPPRALFLSWVKHTTRSLSLAKAVGAECHFIDTGQGLGLLKYLPRAWRSWRLLRRRRPAIVYCMNPPYFLPLLAWAYCKLHGARFILDSHTAAFDCRRWTWLRPMHAWLARRAVLSIVTNEDLATRVRAMGGEALVVTDIPFSLPGNDYQVAADRFTVCFIYTFAEDEPIQEVVEAARRLPGVQFYVTGNTAKAGPELLAARPENLEFTGYLSNEDYAGLLNAVSAIMVLTTRDFTMQRGGSEAVTVGKPLITSDWEILRRTFAKGTVHVDNGAEAIVTALETVRNDYPRFQAGIQELAAERELRWQDAWRELRLKLQQD